MKFLNILILSIIVLFIGKFSTNVNCEEFEKDLFHVTEQCPRNSVNEKPFSLNITMHITQVSQLTVKSFEEVYIFGDCCEISQPQQEVYTFGYGIEPETNLAEIYQGVKLTGNLSYQKDGKNIEKNGVNFILSKIVVTGSYILRIFSQ
ncbi:hypothetical protein RB653_007059 [Dictyostelium firmibasis]|uniref:Uncharacterized protein n=1 Tax=Dictyostelium firmibasis TaxID=79012 RepID=A0AAN7TMQ4_9MYCE